MLAFHNMIRLYNRSTSSSVFGTKKLDWQFQIPRMRSKQSGSAKFDPNMRVTRQTLRMRNRNFCVPKSNLERVAVPDSLPLAIGHRVPTTFCNKNSVNQIRLTLFG